jgi:hypothetical protein
MSKIAYILVKPLSKMKILQAGAHGDDFVIEKGRYYSQVGREHLCVIDLWTMIF